MSDFHPPPLSPPEAPSGVGLVVAAVCLAAGLVLAAYLLAVQLPPRLAGAIGVVQQAKRIITVTGVAEQPVKADMAVWELRFWAPHDDLAAARAKLDKDLNLLRGMMQQSGITENPIMREVITVRDAGVQPPAMDGSRPPRYTLQSRQIMRSTAISGMAALHGRMAEMVGNGLGVDTGSPPPHYQVLKTEPLQQELQALATRQAFASAQQFAAENRLRIVGVQHAVQGKLTLRGADGIDGNDDEESDKIARFSIEVTYQLAE
jgi:hypothetical protein